MGLARDGSIGVLTMRWRRVEIEGALYVEEHWGGARGPVLYGPIPDEASCTTLIRAKASHMKAAFEAGREVSLELYPQSVRLDRETLEDDE